MNDKILGDWPKTQPKFVKIAGMVLVGFLIGGCAMIFSHRVSHSGFSVAVPPHWVDYTHAESDYLNIGAGWGTTGSFIMAKLPGKAKQALTLYRMDYITNSVGGTEDSITTWYEFKGHGFRFRHYSKEGDILDEAVMFYPEADLTGWYIEATFSYLTPGSREGFEEVVSSFRRLR